MRIVFIHDTDPRYGTKARRHVSSVVRQREKEQRSKSTPDSLKYHFQGTASAWFYEGKQKLGETECQSMQHSDNEVHLPPWTSKAPKRTLTKPCRPYPSILDKLLAASPSDPFAALAIKLSPQAQDCLHHYNTCMGEVEFTIDEKSPLIPPRHLALTSAVGSSTCLHAIIAIAAVSRSNITGHGEPLLVAHHLSQALRLFRQSFTALRKDNWHELVQPFIELIACDELRGEHESQAVHLNGLRLLLESYGGLAELDHMPRIQMLVCYVLYGARVAYFHLEIHGRNTTQAHIEQATSDIGLKEAHRRPVDITRTVQQQYIQNHCDQFSRFMNKICGLLRSTSPSMILVRRTFKASSKLTQLLCTSARDEESFGGVGQKGLLRGQYGPWRTWCTLKMEANEAIVSTLMLVVMDLLDLICNADRPGLELHLEKLHFHYHPNIRMFQFFLMMDGSKIQMADPEKHWQVVRMMQIYKTLDAKWRYEANHDLVDFLQGCTPAEGSEVNCVRAAFWTSSALWRNIEPRLSRS